MTPRVAMYEHIFACDVCRLDNYCQEGAKLWARFLDSHKRKKKEPQPVGAEEVGE